MPLGMDQNRTWHEGRPQPRRLCGVRLGPSPLSKKGAEPAPQFSAHVYCGQTAGWIKMALGMEVGLGPSHNVLDGTQLPSPKRGQNPQFSVRYYCRQTAGCINMPLDMEVDLSPGDWFPAASPKKWRSPQFLAHVYCGQTAAWIKVLWYGGRSRPTPHCVRREPASPPLKGHSPPIFGQCSLWPNDWMD